MAEKKIAKAKNVVTPILIVLLVFFAFAIGMLWQQNKSLKSTSTTTPTTTANQPTASVQPAVTLSQVKDLFSKDVVKFGDANKKVLFVEISDPSCPFCHVAAGLNPTLNTQINPQFKLVKDGGPYVAPVPEMKKLVDSGQASFVWIYYPGHGSGEMATKALYCAHDQNKFWEAHDLLMTDKGYTLINETVKNDTTKTQTLVDFLKSAVNSSELKTCLDSGKYDQRLTSESSLAKSLGLQGTPLFFVNDQQFNGAYNYNQMESAVKTALGQ